MANFVLCACLFRIALPLLILTCAVFRPSILSAIYLILLLYSGMVPIPTAKTMAGHTGIYLKLLVAISILGFILQLTFQIVLFSMPPYGHFLIDCEFTEAILRYCGFVRLDGADGIVITTWIAPEIVMTATSIVIFAFCKKLTVLNIESGSEQGEVIQKAKPKTYFGFWVSVGKYIVLISLCVAAVLKPSIPNGIYFLAFIGSCTWWACYKELEKGFAIICRIVMVVVFLHIACLYTYQFDFIQKEVNATSLYARYFGLTPIFNTTCNETRNIEWISMNYDSYLNPLALIWLFYILAIVSKNLLKPKSQKKQGAFSRLEGSINGPLTRQMSQRLSERRLLRAGTSRHRWQSATRKVRVHQGRDDSVNERTPLMRGVSPSRRYSSGSKKTHTNILQDSTGSVTVTGENPDDIPLENLEDEEEKPGCFENALFILESLLQLVIKTSYVATNIIMMTWSITYHSWLTFVLLLWANILWMLPNQRRSTLRSSPFLVIYAIFLLLSGYIFSMDIDNDIPDKIYGISLEQIGFNRIKEYPCNPLLIKCLFTVMFWITLRQHMREIKEARQSSTLADMAAPLQITVGAATGVTKEQEKESQMLKNFGEYLNKFLTRFWIWIVAITLFTVAITGERMTGFRIVYMALFLFFIITFQLSFRIWLKMMFGFWLTVIIYSMIILVLVYTYQFDNFPDYWTKYLHVPVEQQLDIGLEDYDSTQLFVRLVTPTFFVIITVVQLHYFHKDFMEVSTPKEQPTVNPTSEEDSSVQGKVLEQNNDDTDKTDISSLKIDLTDIGNVSTAHIKYRLTAIGKKIYAAINFVFLFLEIHMHKFVLLIAILMSIYDKCALYVLVVLFVIVGITIGRKMQIFVIYASSIFVSLLLLARMVYQIQYIKHDRWNVSCEINNTLNISANNAEWLGFRKTLYGRDLPKLVRWNIGYVLAVTLYTVVIVRQFNYKQSRGKPTGRLFFMFPGITRVDADKNLESCLKYLANYGYYKFGVEISFMATVALIGFRMDLYAILYAIWLCILICLSRYRLAKVWNFYMSFIAVFIPIQYVMVVGLPPGLCIDFPWDTTELLRKLQEWAFLMDYLYPPSAKKLIFDVILLLFVSRQAVVFRIEKRYNNQDYPGGSNESVIHHSEEKDFVNPVPDFITIARTYLDIVKRVVLLGFMWVTLAIVFLAGTNRVNIFSVGYLIGSFIFLWQGSDIYLKPIPRILKSWNRLIAYNVFVILFKTVLQLVGCVFLGDTEDCWIVQLLGIGCVRKFGNPIKQTSLAESQCVVPREYIGLVWDGICFGFLIMQRRIFCSYNFFHMIDETKATTILASRGAELIEQLRQKRMHEQDEQERRILEKIKAKMDRIKATQQKIQGPGYKSSTNHYVDQPPLARSSSVSSCASATSQQTPEAGYHTPIDEDEPAPLTPAAGSLIQAQAPSPFSAIMTVSLEGYLEPQRMSFSSPPNSELNPRPPSPDDSYPVFSPPPYDAAPPYSEVVNVPPAPPQRQTSIGPPWMNGALTTPRQSIISYSSRSPLSHHTYDLYPKSRPMYRRQQPQTYKEAIRSGDYYMFDELDDDDDLEMIEELKPEDEEDLDEDEKIKLKRTASKKRTIGELLSTAMKTDIGTTVRSTAKDARRRASMPLARQKSTMSGRSQYSAPLSAPPIIEESPQRGDRSSDREARSRTEDTEPKPGTSKDEDISDISEPKESKCQKVVDVLLFLWACIDGVLISITNFLNKFSRDYRYVVKVLLKEKKLLKQTTEYTEGIRMGRNQIWQPVGSYHTLLQRSREASMLDLTPTIGTYSPSDSYRLTIATGRALETARINSANNSNNTAVSADSDEKQPPSECSESKAHEAASPLPYSPEKDRRKASVLTVPEIRILAPSLERGLDSPSLIPCSPKQQMIIPKLEEYDPGELSSYDQPTIIRFGLALWYIILNHSDILCYFIIFLNQMKSATLLSLPLPLMVFLWGTLTVPRPSKNFWVTIIAYTQMIVLIKCLFQFEFLPWNREVYGIVNPMNPARIFGVERKANYAVWDLFLLLIVFFHRYLLKCLGLWKTTMYVAPAYHDGEYTIDEEDVHPIKKSEKDISSALVPSETSVQKSKKLSPDRKDSDLQRLVEESEDAVDGEEQTEYTGMDNRVSIRAKDTEPYDMFPDTFHMATSKYFEAIKEFFIQLKDPTSRVAVDVYSYMFMCDFFNFFVILIGYSSFGSQQGDGGVSSYLEDNRVPILFLLMLILQFTLIIVDRAIFLRKNIIAKIVFQFVQIIVLHIWLFIMFPVMTERKFNSVLPPQMYYMVKCFYLLLSAYQIRCGYPSRILGNFLCKGYNYVNMFLFKGFMLIPFLFELRTVMDWMWTDTSMTVFDWIKMEDIFAHIFQLKDFEPPPFLQRIRDIQSEKNKCTRHVENEYPQPRGERKSPTIKYFMGGIILFIIVAVIWFPLVFFSLGNAVGQPNLPYDVTLEIRIGPYEPVYYLSAQSNSIFQFKPQQLKDLLKAYNSRKVASAFISNYEYLDIAAVKLSRDSANVWSISPPDRARMIAEVNSSSPITIRLQYIVSHSSNNKEVSGIIREENSVIMEQEVNGKPNPERQKLLQMLEGEDGIAPVGLGYIMPKFLKVTNRGTAKPVPQLLDVIDKEIKSEELRQLNLTLSKSTDTRELEWWEITEVCSDDNYKHILVNIPYHDCDSIMIYTFNDRIFPETLNLITAGGIIGLYTTLVFVASRVLRGFFSEICFKIMFDDMPNVDRVLQLCLDIYLVREAREFCLEEDLFAKLVFLFRSPETLIKWTRPKEELGDDEDPEGEPE